jgi:3-oxoadipate enol-lactonase
MEFNTNGLKIYYSDAGPKNGLPVVLIHGFPFRSAMWQPQIDALSGRYRVVAADVRGHGRSDAGDGQYTLEFFVDDLLALLDHLEIPSAVLVGLSMGGYIALRAAERNPDRVRALVLCDTRSEADSNEAKVKRSAHIRRVKKDGTGPFAEDFVKSVFSPEAFQNNPSAVEFIKEIIRNNPPAGICGTLLALASRTDATPSLPDIKVPTAVVVGEKDILTPPSLARAMQEKIPEAELHIIPGAAHMSNLENPEEFNKVLLDFLSKLK